MGSAGTGLRVGIILTPTRAVNDFLGAATSEGVWMDFNEKDLVSLLLDHEYFKDFSPFVGLPRLMKNGTKKKSYKGRSDKLIQEFSLESRKRCDIVLCDMSRRRRFWIIECKILADVSSIRQLHNYWTELVSTLPTKISAIAITLAAQHFDEDCLFFSEMMGIQCLHISPVNKTKTVITELTPPVFNKFTRGYNGEN
jgi:hypothetical protein